MISRPQIVHVKVSSEGKYNVLVQESYILFLETSETLCVLEIFTRIFRR